MNSSPGGRRPWEPLEQIRREVGQVLRTLFGEPPAGGAAAWAPHIDVVEGEKEIVVRADLPGVDPAQIDVTVRDNVLVLRGEKKDEQESREGGRHRAERFVGRFHREIPLPPGADVDHIRATAAHGVLTVVVPKKAEAQPRKINVQSG